MSEMNGRPSFDRGLLIPLILGVFSVFGICLVLILGRIAASRETVTPEDTATPFLYLFLGTEPAVVSATPEETQDETEIAGTLDETPTELSFDIGTQEPTQTDSPLIVLATATKTLSSTSTAPLNPGTYDNDDSHLSYEGDWNVQSGVSGVFDGTLHVSTTLGDSVTFRFIGQQIRLFYQSGSGLGTAEIILDGVEFEVSQSDSSTRITEWSSPVLINATHTVVINHLSGGAINLDQLIVPDVLLTPTVSSTP